jgi:hypothetical protein
MAFALVATSMATVVAVAVIRGGVDAVTRLVLGLAPAQWIQDLPQPTSENSVNAKFAE